jgi:hypothetical protein
MLTLLLAACGVPVPEHKADYVGEWTAPGMYLLITQDGSIVYRRMKKGAKISIDGPLKGFTGNDFEAGIGPMATTFKVEFPPHQVDGNWHMTVDGVDMTRQ